MKMKLSVVVLAISMIFFNCSSDKVPDSPLKSKITELLNRMEAQGFAGSVLAEKDDQIIISTGFGLANRKSETPNSAQTVFTIGSITKQFTATAIMKLQMLGKLNINDPITKFFPNVPKDKQTITIHNLLTHTAGFASSIGGDFTPITKNEFIKAALTTPLVRQPGSEYLYSNVGYSLLGIIIEQLSGDSYETFLNKFLFKPAGMKSTGYKIPKWDPSKLAHGYVDSRDWGTLLDRQWDEDGPYWHLRGNGGILSTVEDMYKWHQALEHGKIISENSKEQMITPYVSEGPNTNSHYGYGWALFTTPRETRLVAHNGGNQIFSADMMRFIDEDVVIIVFSNIAGKPAWKVSNAIARIVFDEPFEMPSGEAVELDIQSLAETQMGQRALALIKTYSITDETRTTAFINENLSPRIIEKHTLEKLAGFLAQDQAGIGACDIKKVVQIGERTLELTVVSTKTGDWWKIELRFEAEPPQHIVSINIDDTLPLMEQ